MPTSMPRHKRARDQPVQELLIGASEALLSSDVTQAFLPVSIEKRLRVAGVQSFSDLAKRRDAEFLAIEGISKGSLRTIKKCLEAAVIRDLSSLCHRTHRQTEAVEALRFDQLLEHLSTEELCRPIEDLELPLRCYKRLVSLQVTVVGHLSSFSRNTLLESEGFGRKSLHELEQALRDLVSQSSDATAKLAVASKGASDVVASNEATAHNEEAKENESDLFGEDLNRVLEAALLGMSERSAHVLRHRMGYRTSARTLEDLGQELSVSRERIRQIQRKALGWLASNSNVPEGLALSMSEIIGYRSDPLYAAALPAEHRYFRHLGNAEQVVPFLLEHLCPESYYTLSISNTTVLSRLSEAEWAECKSQARNLIAANVSARIREDVVRAGVDSLLAEKAPELCNELWSWVQSFAHFAGREGEKRLVAYGRGVEQMVVSVLEDAESPLHYSEIATRVSERYGTQDARRVANAASDVALLLDRGVYGTESHLPLSRNEASYVASLCEALVLESDNQHRQWHSREFIEEFATSEPAVAHLNPYEISAILRLHSDLHYVGRQVWVAAKEGRGGVHMRLDIRNAIEAIVEEEGAPLAAAEIYKRINAIRGIGHFQIHPRGRMIRIAPAIWGISERDVPWHDEKEIVLDSLRQCLSERGSALHVSEIAQKLAANVRFDFDAWHLYGLAQADSRFKTFTGEFVGLSHWSASGRLTILDAVRQLSREAQRYWSLAELQERAEPMVERPFSADSLRWSLRNAGASFDVTRGLWDLHLVESNELEDASEPA